MNEFDLKAAGWDDNPMHLRRAEAVAENIMQTIPLNKQMTALEYGAGTGLTSFILKDHLYSITMMDNSQEMIKVMNEKISRDRSGNLKALHFNLEHDEFTDEKFDLIFTQMVMHHVKDVSIIINKFSRILKEGGFLAVADLYTENGSFHGEGFDGHNGFDPEHLGSLMRSKGFHGIAYRKCFTIEKRTPDNAIKEFDVFLLTGQKK